MDDPLLALFLPENRANAVPDILVIPGHANGVNPESITLAPGLWIAGFSLRSALE
jgi:hypothetical protein